MKNKNKENEKNKNEKMNNEKICHDEKCPFHGTLSVRGRYFQGIVKKIFGKRAVVEFERFIYYKKYERYAKARTRLHAYIPSCLDIAIGNIVKVGECRRLSKIMHFVVLKKIK